jgi:hypothetical protein
METLLQLALIILPATGIVITVYLFLKKQQDKEMMSLKLELRKERQTFFLPNRTDAYQRIVLLMERLHPNNMVMRLHNPGLPAKAFQTELLKAIRDEYDHNVAQQIFISQKGWDMVKSSKEEIIKIINLAGTQMEATSLSTDLASKIFEIVSEVGKLPSEIAVEYLKAELQELF